MVKWTGVSFPEIRYSEKQRIELDYIHRILVPSPPPPKVEYTCLIFKKLLDV